MEYREGDYILGFWVVSDPGVHDWMANAAKRADSGDWELEWRFRYYKGEEVWDGKDEKSWYGGTIGGEAPEEVVINAMEVMQKALVAEGFGESTETIMVQSTDVDLMIEKLGKSEHFHMMAVPMGDKKMN